jgi:hypothetical protein
MLLRNELPSGRRTAFFPLDARPFVVAGPATT